MEPKFKPGFLTIFLFFVFIMLLLGWLGGKAVDENILPVAQLSTFLYFLFFIAIIPAYNYFEWWSLKNAAIEKIRSTNTI